MLWHRIMPQYSAVGRLKKDWPVEQQYITAAENLVSNPTERRGARAHVCMHNKYYYGTKPVTMGGWPAVRLTTKCNSMAGKKVYLSIPIHNVSYPSPRAMLPACRTPYPSPFAVLLLTVGSKEGGFPMVAADPSWPIT